MKTRTKIFLIIIIGSLLLSYIQMDKKKLDGFVVIDFEVSDISNQKIILDAIFIKNYLESQLISLNKYIIISKNEIEILSDNKNIDYLVMGSISKVGNNYLISIKSYDTKEQKNIYYLDKFISTNSDELNIGIKKIIKEFISELQNEIIKEKIYLFFYTNILYIFIFNIIYFMITDPIYIFFKLEKQKNLR